MEARGLRDLSGILESLGGVAVAVSGGVDSLTLAATANRILGERAVMYHAVSPAVPPEATARTRALAERLSWWLEVIDAGEFQDERYLGNPVDRCFYCKSDLYRAIGARTASVIASGTNVDDLSDYRPGLRAAAAFGVRHPYVEAGIDKTMVRAIASSLGLEEVAELPASPCLSSRIETGIKVTAAKLGFVHAVESMVRSRVKARTVRCRLRSDRIVVELDADALSLAEETMLADWAAEVEVVGRSFGVTLPVRFAPYRMGGAFLRPET